MDIELEKVQRFRLRAHHLDRKLPAGALEQAAAACGMQNSPPGAWETAMLNRVESCTRRQLDDALYGRKSLLQAWSLRGAPFVFPTAESAVFLAPLAAKEGEQPWIYTRGITAALDFLGLTFDVLLPLVKKAAGCLESRTITGKDVLDRELARLVEPELAPEKRALWNAPSMYDAAGRQTVGEAVVSFLLRPCSFSSLVVFGRRQGASPAFTSFTNWTGRAPCGQPGAARSLVRKYLHCYGPSGPSAFADWLGCAPAQAKRLWSAAADEMAPVRLEGRPCWMLEEDLAALGAGAVEGESLLLLGAHDPYLDLRDRHVILAHAAHRRAVWRTVGNPGVILRGGRIAGLWRARVEGGGLEFALTLWEEPGPSGRRVLAALAQEHAAFRGLPVRKYAVEDAL